MRLSSRNYHVLLLSQGCLLARIGTRHRENRRFGGQIGVSSSGIPCQRKLPGSHAKISDKTMENNVRRNAALCVENIPRVRIPCATVLGRRRRELATVQADRGEARVVCREVRLISQARFRYHSTLNPALQLQTDLFCLRQNEPMI